MKKRLFYSVFICFLAFSACDKNESSSDEPEIPVASSSQDVYVLTQGNFYAGIEGALDLISIDDHSIQRNIFMSANGRTLGDTPQCGIVYGSKLYIGTYESNTLEIIDRFSKKSLKQIKFSDLTEGGQPYSMVADDGKVFISLYGGNLARLDTTTLVIDKITAVGNNPDQIAIHRDKIFVPISDGMNYPNYGTTAVVVDPKTMSVERTIKTDLNPSKFFTVEDRLFLLCKGNYTPQHPSLLYEINEDYTLSKIAAATIAAPFKDNIAIINQPFVEEGDPIVEYKLYNLPSNNLINWDITRPDYANNIYYDESADRLMISSYVMSGNYPSYLLPGYVNQYSKDEKSIEVRYNLGSAGPAYIFSHQ